MDPLGAGSASSMEYEYSSYSDLSSDLESEETSSPRKPRLPRTVAGRYKLGRKLGEGSYSEVYAATDGKSGETVAVKIEWQKAEKTDKLLKEAELYKSLQHGVGVPRVHWSGSKGEYNIMVLDVLGPSLDDLFKKLKRFSVKTVVMSAKQIIDRLRHVHDCGILYRDIKPHNFLMGVGEEGSRRVYLVDYGLAKRYRDAVTGEHAPMHIKKGRGITGTVRYTSPNVHEGYDASRRDDLLALGYVLMHLLRGDLPWLKVSSKDKKLRNEKIRKKKAETTDEQLCSGFPAGFIEYFQYLRSLQFYDEPDYSRLQRIMDSILEEEDLEHDLMFDWSSGDRDRKRRRTLN